MYRVKMIFEDGSLRESDMQWPTRYLVVQEEMPRVMGGDEPHLIYLNLWDRIKANDPHVMVITLERQRLGEDGGVSYKEIDRRLRSEESYVTNAG